MKKGISQEGLKLVACIAMLIDHIGYELINKLYIAASSGGALMQARNLYRTYYVCRCIGRIAFPIYVFLLVEGFHRTLHRKQYALRLAIGALLAEVPFDLMVSGTMFGPKQSVMVTLLLGFLALAAMDRCRNFSLKPLVAVPFALLAHLLRCDYGWQGIALVVIFEMSGHMTRQNLIRFCAMVILFHYSNSTILQIGGISLPMQTLGALSVLFISAYDGRKLTNSKTVQWIFYLFYPVHLLVLWLIGILIPAGVLL